LNNENEPSFGNVPNDAARNAARGRIEIVAATRRHSKVDHFVFIKIVESIS